MPLAVVGLVMTGGGGLIVKVNVALPVPLLFVALSVTLYGLPASVPTAGVPEIAPVEVLTDSPVGRPWRCS